MTQYIPKLGIEWSVMGDTEPDLRALLPRLMQLSNVLSRSGLAERAMEHAGIGLDRPALTILIMLRMADTPLRVGEIATRMQVAGPHVTRHTQELERRELVRRLPDADDRRARQVEPTPAGAEIADRYLSTVLGWLGDALTGWAAEDRQTFYRLLRRFTEDLATRLSTIDT
jgi:DNA-binding MarR family transcriptional regulator